MQKNISLLKNFLNWNKELETVSFKYEFRRLGYKNPLHTSQETHYVSATEPSRWMLCKIWGFHGGGYEECRILRYKTQVVPHRKHITSQLQGPVG
jgi:hypothetical protein